MELCDYETKSKIKNRVINNLKTCNYSLKEIIIIKSFSFLDE